MTPKQPFTDSEFNEIRRNLTTRGAEGEDTVHAGAAKMFERLFATVDLRASIISPVGIPAGRVYANLLDPGPEWVVIAMLVRSPKTGTLAIQQSRVPRVALLRDPEGYAHAVITEAGAALLQLLQSEGK